MTTDTRSPYDAQADAFLSRFGITVAIVLRSPESCPPWSGTDKREIRGPSTCPTCRTVHGREYLVTLTREADKRRRLAFPFWGAHADRPDPDARMTTPARRGKHPSAYDVLACLSSDATMPDTADEVAAEFGDMPPSRAQEIAAWGAKVRAFFTPDERDALADIQ